ncbi:MAG: Stp1/IreP family PP2C-type Ser/Thr phosphatase [Lachnospiraceae bacterium]|nr:Stp1/IreP family PP2C-type Ser/Thr phosphatase [Lachnospiraceae bacterium]
MEAYGMTDVGLERNVNQDSIYYTTSSIGPLKNLFMVADGMGGHAAGDFASKFTLDSLVKIFSESKDTQLISSIDSGIHLVNSMLVRYADENLDMYGMGTTLVLATIEDNILYVANVGDSRLYVIDDHINQITRDHSYVEEMVNRGQMVRGSEEYYNKKSRITRAIGSPTGVAVDFFEIELHRDTRILLCSDGLTNMLTDEQIFSIVKKNSSVELQVTELVNAANKNGGTDNISVLMVLP